MASKALIFADFGGSVGWAYLSSGETLEEASLQQLVPSDAILAEMSVADLLNVLKRGNPSVPLPSRVEKARAINAVKSNWLSILTGSDVASIQTPTIKVTKHDAIARAIALGIKKVPVYDEHKKKEIRQPLERASIANIMALCDIWEKNLTTSLQSSDDEHPEASSSQSSLPATAGATVQSPPVIEIDTEAPRPRHKKAIQEASHGMPPPVPLPEVSSETSIPSPLHAPAHDVTCNFDALLAETVADPKPVSELKSLWSAARVEAAVEIQQAWKQHKERFIIMVKNLQGKSVQYMVHSNDTVAKLKLQIYRKEHIQADTQVLQFGMNILENEEQLSRYNIQKDSTIHLTSKLGGGGKRALSKAPSTMGKDEAVSMFKTELDDLVTLIKASKASDLSQTIVDKVNQYHEMCKEKGQDVFKHALSQLDTDTLKSLSLSTSNYEFQLRVMGLVKVLCKQEMNDLEKRRQELTLSEKILYTLTALAVTRTYQTHSAIQWKQLDSDIVDALTSVAQKPKTQEETPASSCTIA